MSKFKQFRNSGMGLLQVMVMAATLTASIAYVTKLIHNETKNRAEYLSNILGAEIASAMKIQLTNPEVCSETFQTTNINSLPEVIDNISGLPVTPLYSLGDKFGLGGEKVQFQGLNLIEPTAGLDNVYSGFIRFIKVGILGKNKPYGVPFSIKVTKQSAGGVIETCYQNSLDELDQSFDDMCVAVGGNFNNDKCEGIQAEWKKKIVPVLCDEVRGTKDVDGNECLHPNQGEDPCSTANSCFIIGYDDSKLTTCNATCPQASRISTEVSPFPDQGGGTCGTQCVGTCVESYEGSVSTACGQPAGCRLNRCYEPNNVIRRPCDPYLATAPCCSPTCSAVTRAATCSLATGGSQFNDGCGVRRCSGSLDCSVPPDPPDPPDPLEPACVHSCNAGTRAATCTLATGGARFANTCGAVVCEGSADCSIAPPTPVACTGGTASWGSWVNANVSTCNAACRRNRTQTCRGNGACGARCGTTPIGGTRTQNNVVACTAGQGSCPAAAPACPAQTIFSANRVCSDRVRAGSDGDTTEAHDNTQPGDPRCRPLKQMEWDVRVQCTGGSWRVISTSHRCGCRG
jgi:hypothetical protein